MIKQKVARRQTDKEIRANATKVGPECLEQYEKHLKVLTMMLEDVTDESGEALAGFMFAFASLSNEIARRNNIK